jgi:hypothetical protein
MIGLGLSLTMARGGGGGGPPSIAGTLIELWAGNYQSWVLNGSKIASGTFGGSLGVTFSNSTDAFRPTIVPNGINGQPCIRFVKATAQWLDTSSFSLPADIQCFCVLQTDGDIPASAGRIISQGTDTSGNNLCIRLIPTNSVTFITDGNDVQKTTPAVPFGSTPSSILVKTITGFPISCEVNAGGPMIGAIADGIGTTASVAKIGGSLNNASGERFDGDLAYLGIFDGTADLGPLVSWA